MNIDGNVFWNLLAHSKLIQTERIETLASQISEKLANGKGQEADANAIAHSLIDDNVITKYQAEILLAGRAGPFRFGDYLIVDQIPEGPLQGSFLGIHGDSNHPVTIEFFSGDDLSAVKQWKQIQDKSKFCSQIDAPNLVVPYESVVLPQYRMLVSPQIRGTSLQQKLPRKARLPWKDSCGVAAQIAMGLHHLHQKDVVHTAISPRAIWMTNKGPATLRLSLLPDIAFEPHDEKSESRLDYVAPELEDEPSFSRATDIYSLGCTLHRMIRGLAPFAESSNRQKRESHQKQIPAALGKYELPKELQILLDKMLSKKPSARPEAYAVAQQLAELSGKGDRVFDSPSQSRTTEKDYRQALASGPLFGKPTVSEPNAPQIVTASTETELTDAELAQRKERLASPRKRKNWGPVVLTATLIGFTATIGLIAWWANQKDFTPPQVITQNPDLNQSDSQDDPDTSTNSNNKATDSTETIQGRLIQEFVEDDGSRLWETPTNGQQVDFGYLPTGAKVAFSIKPNSLLATEEGKRVLTALGPQFQSSSQWFESTSGVDLIDVDELLIAFCSVNQDRFAACYVVRPSQPINRTQLTERWRPQVTGFDESTGIYQNANGFGYYLIPDANDPEMITGFAMGPLAQMKIVSELVGANPLSGPLKSLQASTDRERHFNCLFVKNALFNDEGQSLMSGLLKSMNTYLRDQLPEEVRGGMISMHLDAGCYLETAIDHSLEIKPREMSDKIDELLQRFRDDVTNVLSLSPPNPFWDQLRSRFTIMINEVYRNARVDVEGGLVMANCWLPEIAAHNLVAGSEMALSFSSGAASQTEVVKKIPQSLEELLSTPRDLTVTTNPDLGLLLAGLKDEIVDDFGNLPFAFDIKLLGNDLLKDGITQNQRPGNFEIRQKPLSEILTGIMFRANPDPDAKGPNDPACKLIWVVAEEPAGSGQPIVLITTRDGAAKKGYRLPEAFVVKE